MSIKIDAPFYDLRKTMTCGQVFRYKELPGGVFEVHSVAKVCTVQEASGFLDVTCDECDNQYWETYFNPIKEPEVLQVIMSQNHILKQAYEFSKGTQLLRQDPFECLCSFIISQQKRIPQIQSCVETLCRLAGPALPDGSYGFPEPQYITRDVVFQLKLGYRTPYLINAVEEVASGNLILEDYVAEKVSYETAMSRLQRLYGVGTKIADCVALFGLGFKRAFPVDTHIKKVLELPEMHNFREEDCGDYAGLVQQYLYNYALYNGY